MNRDTIRQIIKEVFERSPEVERNNISVMRVNQLVSMIYELIDKTECNTKDPKKNKIAKLNAQLLSSAIEDLNIPDIKTKSDLIRKLSDLRSYYNILCIHRPRKRDFNWLFMKKPDPLPSNEEIFYSCESMFEIYVNIFKQLRETLDMLDKTIDREDVESKKHIQIGHNKASLYREFTWKLRDRAYKLIEQYGQFSDIGLNALSLIEKIDKFKWNNYNSQEEQDRAWRDFKSSYEYKKLHDLLIQ